MQAEIEVLRDRPGHYSCVTNRANVNIAGYHLHKLLPGKSGKPGYDLWFSKRYSAPG